MNETPPGARSAGQLGQGRDDFAASGLVVAVDGPSGSGKSTAARGAATALGLRYLDTGAMYRALTWWMLEHHIDLADTDTVVKHGVRLSLDIGTDPVTQSVVVDGADVTAPIRSRRVSNAVSQVASIPQIRQHLVAMQQHIISQAVAEAGGIVAEGRDIGTAVAPDAAVKVFLTASERARAERRAAELAAPAESKAPCGATTPGTPEATTPEATTPEATTPEATTPEATTPEATTPEATTAEATTAEATGAVPGADVTLREQARRDQLDAPQSQRADDAVEVDATDLSLDDVIELIVGLARSKRATA